MGLTICHAFGICSACHKSYFFCKVNQRSGVVSKARDKRNAISGVIEPFPFMIFGNVFLDTPRVDDISFIVMDNGIK